MKRRPSTTQAASVHAAALTPLSGMRDLLPPESRARRKVSEQLQGVFERSGYELVTTPLFERVEVFERGFALDPRDLLRFVEPDGGEIAALRPDITPQIARVVATRLAELPPPFRLRYEGSVIRRRRGRARQQRQIAQVGIELLGISGAEADVEVIRLIAEACSAAGLRDFRIELSDVGVGRTLLRELAPELLELAAEPLARKDGARLESVLASAGVEPAARARLVALAHLHGELAALDEAAQVVRGTGAEAHVASVCEVADQLVSAGLGAKLGVDLGEIRGLAYYTGVSFALFAQGPGEAIASGGRYDQLLAQYGAPLPATGAGIDVENLLSALDCAGLPWREGDAARFVLAGASARVEAIARLLRARGLCAATLPGAEGKPNLGQAYARAWGYDACIVASEANIVALRGRDGAKRELGTDPSGIDGDALSSWARAAEKG